MHDTASTAPFTYAPIQDPETRFLPVRRPQAVMTALKIERRNVPEGTDVYDIPWARRTATISDGDGGTLFEQKDIEAPEAWSQQATNVVANKYFRGHLGMPGRETSVRQVISRVADTITAWGEADGYFDAGGARAFRDELTYLLLHQHAAMASPVWFNVGAVQRPQAAACFLNTVDDSMESIMDLARAESRLFKSGSGSGVNLSRLRGKGEPLSGGGYSSGLLSFMRGLDGFAGAIKSGGRTRRAACMRILNAEHPDILEFVTCKADEEKKAWALIAAGYDPSLDGPAYATVGFQNANHSVRAPDAFMQAVVDDGPWQTKSVLTGQPMKTYRARELMAAICEAAYLCGDPGMQFDSTINRWNTCKTAGRINTSNPCSEHVFLDHTACNLASLNLRKFMTNGCFDAVRFQHAVDIIILAQEILVDNSSYPTEAIAATTRDYRPLGLGYANLGALLMEQGLAYDSAVGRNFATGITALMCGQAYLQSARIAQTRGAFAGYSENRESMLDVIKTHREAAHGLPASDLAYLAGNAWTRAHDVGETHGFRNGQVCVLAPTGTIAFMMDCDTTGIEPDMALVKHKRLVGGGLLKMVNQTVPVALERLGYDVPKVMAHINEHGTIEGAIKDADLPVFDCAFRGNGTRSIAPMGHIRMMAAVQPFISGAISKTVNVDKEATAKDIEKIYVESWKLGIKAVAVYRDGCKQAQPVITETKKTAIAPIVEMRPPRRHLPNERAAITHKFSVAGHEGYLTVGLYEDGTPGELFVTMSKEGSTISGLMDTIATSASISLQYGVPLEALVSKFSHMRFEPAGLTENPKIPIAKSIVDYVFRWIGQKFLPATDAVPTETPSLPAMAPPETPRVMSAAVRAAAHAQADAPACSNCGSITRRAGSCYACDNCGTTSGCG